MANKGWTDVLGAIAVLAYMIFKALGDGDAETDKQGEKDAPATNEEGGHHVESI